jgi:hypothetical protein
VILIVLFLSYPQTHAPVELDIPLLVLDFLILALSLCTDIIHYFYLLARVNYV